MAHVALLHAEDPELRRQFKESVRHLFDRLPQTVQGEVDAGPVACVWATGPSAPVDVRREAGSFALLIGYAVDDAGAWATAASLANTWLADDGHRHAHDGYHAGIAIDPAGGLVAGFDPLGLFPLYYTSLADGSIMVASTPEAFLAHPGFDWRIDRRGLAGILLANGLLDNQPLLTGIRRLARGHRLTFRPGSRPREVKIFDIFPNPPVHEDPFEVSCDRIHTIWLDALRRHRPPGDDAALLLSGGLDSRLVAGSMQRLGMPIRALTLGRPRDYEVRAARLVTNELECPVEVVSTDQVMPEDVFAAFMRSNIRFNHLVAAPAGDDFAIGVQAAGMTNRYCWSGLGLDFTFQPVKERSGYQPESDSWSFDLFVHHMNSWGVPLDRLSKLLGDDGDLICRDWLELLRDRCVAGARAPGVEAGLLRFDQRVRNHIANTIHQISFHTWPLLPATDRRFFSAFFDLPYAAFAHRGLEAAIVRREYPRLAGIPLDNNSFRFDPIGGASKGNTWQRRLKTGAILARTATQVFLPGSDPRRYARLFNVDHPRWRAVRCAAEQSRSRLHEHLDARVLRELMPAPNRRVWKVDPVAGGSAVRLLSGLALLLDR